MNNSNIVYYDQYLAHQKLKVYSTTIILTIFILAIMIKIYKMLLTKLKVFYEKKKNNILVRTRFISILPYFLPFMDGIENFGLRVLPDYPFRILKAYRLILAPLMTMYIENRHINLISFLALYFLIVNSSSPLPTSEFLRFNTLQALLLFLITALLGSSFRALPIEFKTSLTGLLICNSCFWFISGIVIYAIVKCCKGEYSRIPVISEAVRIQVESDGI
uniref:Tic20 family protein Ycf60 n=1 Tax=Boldia erythrosiphon TaxID=74908 RepID=A0A1Y9TM21_9RHOD|nr:conserved hypothetical plastid protein [Boldia erythrosiphon]ARO90671.1 conserved hypothetical plastid protein [Boldia erythrosiphon]